MFVVDVAWDLTPSRMPCRRLQPIGQSVSFNADFKHTAQGKVAGNRKRNFSCEGCEASDVKRCGRFVHVQRHGVEGGVEDTLFVKLVEKGGQGDVLKGPCVVRSLPKDRFIGELVLLDFGEDLLEGFENAGGRISPR